MKYKTNRKWASTIGVLFTLGLFIVAILSPNKVDSELLILALPFIFLILNAFWGTYLYLDEEKIYKVNEFFLKKSLKVQNVILINYYQTFNLGKNFERYYKSLYIIGVSENGNSKMIRLSNDAFTEKTLSEITKKLKELNPRINLDKEAELLVSKYHAK